MLGDRYAGVADRLVPYFAGVAWSREPAVLEPWADVARQLRALG